jgi:hypothetical protein
MLAHRKFTAQDYERMANELEVMSETICLHPEMNHHTSERLKALVREMREDARVQKMKKHPSLPLEDTLKKSFQ